MYILCITQILPQGVIFGFWNIAFGPQLSKEYDWTIKQINGFPTSPLTMKYLGVNFTFLLEGAVLGLWNFACGPQLPKE